MEGWNRRHQSLPSYLGITAALLIALTQLARADTYTVDFASLDLMDHSASTGVWNTVTGKIEGAYTANGTALDFGDASDGVFDFSSTGSGPIQTGITQVDSNTLQFNTTDKSEFQFRSFTLGSGKTILITGTNPLVIRVHGATQIDGAIRAEGQAGQDNAASGVRTGGTSVAGGGAGGNGGYGAAMPGTSATAGTASGANALGGGIGANVNTSTTQFGGGGGCNGAGADAGNNATTGYEGGGPSGTPNQGACGSTRATVAAAFESVFTGGAGGGGGSAFFGGINGNVTGAAGGGGGGKIRLVSLGTITLGAGAVISAKGGDGGDVLVANTTTDYGGAGGGGSGGSIWFQTPATITGTGTVNISGGIGGNDPTTIAHGGNGSRGIFRADTSVVGGGEDGTVTVTPARVASLDSAQQVAISNATYQVVSKAIPLFYQGYYDLTSVTQTPADPTAGLTLTYEGSHDGVTWVHSVPAAQISELSDYAYIRFKASLTTTGGAPVLTGLSFEYSLKNMTDLTLRGSPFLCGRLESRGGIGARSSNSDGGTLLKSMLGDLVVLAAALFWGRRLAKSPIRASLPA